MRVLRALAATEADHYSPLSLQPRASWDFTRNIRFLTRACAHLGGSFYKMYIFGTSQSPLAIAGPKKLYGMISMPLDLG